MMHDKSNRRKGRISQKYEWSRSNWGVDTSFATEFCSARIPMTSSLPNILKNEGIDVDPNTELKPKSDDSDNSN